VTSYTMPICLGCEHYRGLLDTSCDAFPAGIPPIILEDRFDHRSGLTGDHGIRFEPAANGPQVLADVEADRRATGRVVTGAPK
jgi:hypothetical protein